LISVATVSDKEIHIRHPKQFSLVDLATALHDFAPYLLVGSPSPLNNKGSAKLVCRSCKIVAAEDSGFVYAAFVDHLFDEFLKDNSRDNIPGPKPEALGPCTHSHDDKVFVVTRAWMDEDGESQGAMGFMCPDCVERIDWIVRMNFKAYLLEIKCQNLTRQSGSLVIASSTLALFDILRHEDREVTLACIDCDSVITDDPESLSSVVLLHVLQRLFKTSPQSIA